MSSEYRALETIIHGKIARLERHIAQISHDKTLVKETNTPTMYARPPGSQSPIGTLRPTLGPRSMGVVKTSNGDEGMKDLLKPRYTPEQYRLCILGLNTQIAARRREIRMVKGVLKKVGELPDERRVQGMMSFVDLYKDYKEPVLTGGFIPKDSDALSLGAPRPVGRLAKLRAYTPR